MNKDQVVGLGLIGVSLIGIGALIGGFIVKKIDDEFEKHSANAWRDTAMTFKELLIDSYAKQDELRKKIEKVGD